jgi:hypothetical protein
MQRKHVYIALIAFELLALMLTSTCLVKGQIFYNSNIEPNTGTIALNDGFADTSQGGLTVTSPHNRTYNTADIPLDITLAVTGFHGALTYTVNYTLDGKYQSEIPISADYSQLHVTVQATGSASMSKLSEGSHCIAVTYESDIQTGAQPGAPFKPKGEGLYYLTYTVTVYFTVDAMPPELFNISVANQTYPQPDVPLNFTHYDDISQVTYSLDGNQNTTITDNTTLTGLQVGSHNLKMYANDDAGNTFVSQPLNFTVANLTTKVSTQPQTFPTTLAITVCTASAATVAIAALALIRHRRGSFGAGN